MFQLVLEQKHTENYTNKAAAQLTLETYEDLNALFQMETIIASSMTNWLRTRCSKQNISLFI